MIPVAEERKEEFIWIFCANCKIKRPQFYAAAFHKLKTNLVTFASALFLGALFAGFFLA